MEPAPPFSAELSRVRRNPWVLGLAASPFLGTLAALVAGFAVKAAFFAFLFHPAIVAIIALLYAWQRNPWAVIEPLPVRADAAGVHVGDTFIPLADIKDGFVLPGRTPQVRLSRRRALPLELRCGSVAEARSLLRALGLDVSQRVAQFRTSSRAVAKRRYTAVAVGTFMAVYGAFVASIARANHGHSPALAGVFGVAFALSLIGLVTVMLVPTRLGVGADGIVLRWFGRSRFLGYGDITGVFRFDKGWGRNRQIGLTVTLRSGEEVAIPIGQAKWNDDGVAIIEERMEEAMEAFRGGGAAADAALLRRGDRPVAGWIDALRAIGSGANADMRTAPLPRERLFRIVESPTAAAPDRAAAAVALSADLDDDARTRLRRAADAIAAPRLRVVLEHAAAGAEQAEVEAALAEMDAEEAKRRAG
jgi:hypothetical protein